MAEFIVGEPVSVAVIVTQNDPLTGQPVLDGSGNPIRLDDASMSCTVYKPDGTTTSAGVTRVSLGAYTAQFTPDQSQWWEAVFSGITTAPGKGRVRIYVSPVP